MIMWFMVYGQRFIKQNKETSNESPKRKNLGPLDYPFDEIDDPPDLKLLFLQLEWNGSVFLNYVVLFYLVISVHEKKNEKHYKVFLLTF